MYVAQYTNVCMCVVYKLSSIHCSKPLVNIVNKYVGVIILLFHDSVVVWSSQ